MDELLALLTAEPEWDLGTAEPVPVRSWGKDHWTTFAYVETRWVDHRGMLSHDQMRCDRQRHPAFYSAKRRAIAMGTDADGARYPTRLKTETPGDNDRWGVVQLPGHDDYDCLNDAIQAGLIAATMPRPSDGVYLDALGQPCRLPDGCPITPPLTGLTEMWLMTAASFSLTGRGREVAAQLRAHLATARNSHQFMPTEEG